MIVRVEVPVHLVLTAAWLLAAGSSPAEDLARRIDAHHRDVKDFTAHFVQTYRSSMLGQEVVESGKLAMKRPGLMRWEYEKPERKLFVADGTALYFYVPADRQVVRRERDAQRGVALDLLTGAGVLDQFTPGLEASPSGRPRLRLVPRHDDPDVAAVYVEADATGRILSIEVHDTQGAQSRFRFESVRENAGLPDTLFRFEVPKGIEVITG